MLTWNVIKKILNLFCRYQGTNLRVWLPTSAHKEAEMVPIEAALQPVHG